jgi:hypothetical protein
MQEGTGGWRSGWKAGKVEEGCLSIIINGGLIAYLSEKVEPYYRLTLDIFIVGLN